MKRAAIILLAIGTLLAFAAPAQARQHWQIVHPIVTQPACPTGVPVQTITVINQTNVRPDRLALVERATVDQSLQVRQWWGTPCVHFGPGGWDVTLVRGAPSCGEEGYAGCHSYTLDAPSYMPGPPFALVSVNAASPWSVSFSHEILETLADPLGTGYEICDRLLGAQYRLDGVWVADFLTPAWFAQRSGRLDFVGLMRRNGYEASPRRFAGQWRF